MVIADHAPTALIAARVLGIPRATFGSGFELPPAISPFPSMRPWLNVPPERLMQSDQRVLGTINAAMGVLSAQPLQQLSDLFACAKHFLITFSELDPYSSRIAAQYYGPILAPANGDIPQWPQGHGPKVFAYLKPHYEQLEGVFAALAAQECRTAAFVGGLSLDRLGKIRNSTTVVSPAPYDIERAASECDFGVCHAGHGTTCALLLKGKPVLLLPMQLEQFLTAKRVSETGAGVLVGGEKPHNDLRAAASQIVGNPALARRAQAFAQRYAGYRSSSTVARIASECDEFVRHRRNERREASPNKVQAK
jgi:UDP:flavonoid glycosyltransferase YjiC (YdhE family)